jgi:hypothetical protein
MSSKGEPDMSVKMLNFTATLPFEYKRRFRNNSDPKGRDSLEPLPERKMSMEEYVEFCELCLKSNSRITPENCLQRGEGIPKPFRI